MATDVPPDDFLATAAAGSAAARGGGLRVGGYLVGILFGVVSASLLFRHLGVADTGQYITALSLVAIVGALSDLGLTAVGVRELSTRPPEERWPLTRDLLGLRIVLTLLGSAVVIAVAWVAYSSTLAAGVALACVGLLLQATQDNFALPLLIGLRLGWVSALDLSRQLFTAVFIVLLVLTGATLVPFLGVSIPVGAIVLAATAVLVRGTRTLMPAFSLDRWRRFLGPMIPYSLAVAASALYFRVSILLVSVLGTAAEVGYFGASFRIIEVLTLVPGLLVGSALPIFARAAHDDHDRLGYALGRVFEVSLIAGAWIAVSIAVGAPLAIKIVGGPKFAPAAPVLAIQGVALGAMFVSMVWANALLSLGLFRLILAINLAALALNAILVGALIPLDGARGAAIGTALAEIVAAVVQAAAVVHGRPRLRPSLRIVPGVALAAALGLAPLALTGIPVIARLALSTALFAGALLATRAYPPELLELLPGLRANAASRTS
jgi:O-antigen/teichoic acid export membrane protein